MRSDDVIQREWRARADLLRRLLREHGADNADFRADLGRRRFWWQARDDGRPLVVADVRVLCSYALSNGSVLAGWANVHLPAGVAVDAVDGLADDVEDASEDAAWAYALAVADGSAAEFVYRAPNPQSWVFLGLWNVRAAADDDDAFSAGRPWDHVRRVLGALGGVADRESRAALSRNYGRSFIENDIARGTPWQAPQADIGRRLVALADVSDDEFAAGLADLIADVPVD